MFPKVSLHLPKRNPQGSPVYPLKNPIIIGLHSKYHWFWDAAQTVSGWSLTHTQPLAIGFWKNLYENATRWTNEQTCKSNWIYTTLIYIKIYNWSSKLTDPQNQLIFQSTWSNYSDVTRPHLKRWLRQGNPLISGKSRWVKYYNLARINWS